MSNDPIIDDIIKNVSDLSEKELKVYAATYLKIIQHLTLLSDESKVESRRREKMRLKIARRTIAAWKFYIETNI